MLMYAGAMLLSTAEIFHPYDARAYKGLVGSN
jgi:hypothetical protein